MERANDGAGRPGRRKRENCWDLTACGLGPGGDRVDELGVCPAALPVEQRRDGLNRGTHGGRVCWAIAGTPCSRDHAGNPRSVQSRFLDCVECPVLKQVQEEEGLDFDFGLH